MTSATNVEISATPPRRLEEFSFLRNELARNGVMRAAATVKTTTAKMNDVRSMSNPENTSDATIRPTAFASSMTPVLTMSLIIRRRAYSGARTGATGS